MKKSSKSSLKKKRSLDISLQHKIKLTINFLKKKLLHLAEKRAGGERVKSRRIYKSMSLNTHPTPCLYKTHLERGSTQKSSPPPDGKAQCDRSKELLEHPQ